MLAGTLSINLRLLRHKNINIRLKISIYTEKTNTHYIWRVCSYIISFAISLLQWKDPEISLKMNSQWREKPRFEPTLSDFNGHMISFGVDCFSTFVISNVVSTRHLVFLGVSGDMEQTGEKHYFDSVWKERWKFLCQFYGPF